MMHARLFAVEIISMVLVNCASSQSPPPEEPHPQPPTEEPSLNESIAEPDAGQTIRPPAGDRCLLDDEQVALVSPDGDDLFIGVTITTSDDEHMLLRVSVADEILLEETSLSETENLDGYTAMSLVDDGDRDIWIRLPNEARVGAEFAFLDVDDNIMASGQLDMVPEWPHPSIDETCYAMGISGERHLFSPDGLIALLEIEYSIPDICDSGDEEADPMPRRCTLHVLRISG